MSFGLTVPAYIFPDWDTTIRYNSTQRPGGGSYPKGTVHSSTNFSSIGGMLELKVYLPGGSFGGAGFTRSWPNVREKTVAISSGVQRPSTCMVRAGAG